MKVVQNGFHLGWRPMSQIKSMKLMSHNQLTTTSTQNEKMVK